ncbi:MAG: hypothetical protein LBC68_14540 [Prevotellaceae bacterium]|jgi:hypothetical protein|nr:hypothetical protein [Prevotellaceae bacterium]
MINKQLTWPEFKALYQLYHNHKTNLKIQERPYFKYLMREGYVRKKSGSPGTTESYGKFANEYRQENIENLYHKYYSFLSENMILTSHTPFSEFEIKCLINIKQCENVIVDNGQTLLSEMRSKIEAGKDGRKGISKSFFKSAKHIEKGSALEDAVLRIIGIDRFPQNEGQWIYRVPCKNPFCIILCENRYFLTLDIAQKRNVELWHVGGNNTLPIENLPGIKHPIYYLCDWDLTGLQIYERIYRRIEIIKDKASSLQLLTPNGTPEYINETEEYHRSRWDKTTELSSLSEELYSHEQLDLIRNLIQTDKWIEEEGNDIGKIIDKIKNSDFEK